MKVKKYLRFFMSVMLFCGSTNYALASTVTLKVNSSDAKYPDNSTEKTLTNNYGEKTNFSLTTGYIPSRPGYTFSGFYDDPENGTQVYKNDGNGAQWNDYWDYHPVWIYEKDVTLYAHWTANTYKVTFDSNGGSYKGSYSYTYGSTYASQNEFPFLSRTGYKFAGWYKADGTRVQASALVEASNITLYAHWIGNQFTATLCIQKVLNYETAGAHWNNGGQDSRTITVTAGEDMPAMSADNMPVCGNAEYEFLGFKDVNQTGNGKMYYGPTMQSLCKWDKTYDNAQLYGVFMRKGTFTRVTIDAGEGTFQEASYISASNFQGVSTDRHQCTFVLPIGSEQLNGGYMELSNSLSNYQYTSFITKPGYRLTGLYAHEIVDGRTVDVKVFKVNNTYQLIPVNSTVANKYWQGSTWKGTGETGDQTLTLYADYAPIYSNNLNGSHQIIFYDRGSSPTDGFNNVFNSDDYTGMGNFYITAADVQAAIDNTNNGGIDSNIDIIDLYTFFNGDLADDNISPVMEVIKQYKTLGNISANVLIYYKGSPTQGYVNACSSNGLDDDGQPKFQNYAGILVTDRQPMTVKYKIIAYKADYDRILSSLGQQAKWGTICLPFKVDLNNTNCSMDFYILKDVVTTDGVNAGTMVFAPYSPSDGVINANTPLVYKVNEAGGGNSGIGVHQEDWQHAFYMPVSAHEDQHTTDYAHPYGWELIGTRTDRTFHGSSFNGSESVSDFYLSNHPDLDAIYYISYDDSKYNEETGTYGMDVFSCLTEKKEVTVPPYRAYFARQFVAGAKCTNYSLMVYDEEGNSTDITDLLDNENAVGDGKIYDLNGVRVKNPIKGHIYIVNGKKKVY